jgi:tripartite-type tricarboxylate transporter receptor subunit TctC
MNHKCKLVPVLALLLGMAQAGAADYPDKPIKIVIAFPPGGPTDSSIRIIAEKLSELMKQVIIVENKGGAGGNIGSQFVARSEPDGYTLLANSAAYAVNPTLYASRAGYDPIKDFIPIVVVSTQPNVISVNEKVPVTTLAELKTLAKNGKLSFSSPGSGTTPHLTCENIFHVKWNQDIVHVPYKGAGPASLAVVAGDTPIACTAAYGVFQFHKLGRVRILGISSEKRLPNLPDVPTFIELGYPDIKDYTWTTLFAPAGTPAAIVQKLNTAVNQLLAIPDLKDKLEKSGLIPVGGPLQETSTYIAAEVKHWGQVVRNTGAKVD